MAQQKEYRNIMIIGPNNTGKSTIASKILACDDLSQTQTIATVNKTERTISGNNYEITVVDAIGLGSSKAMSQQRVTELKKCLMRQKIYTINLILFVIAADRLTRSDKSILESAIERFNHSNMSKISALAITYCEQYHETKRRDIVKLFEEGDYTKAISDLMGKGIITTGFVSPHNCNELLESNDEDDLNKIDNLIVKSCTEEETSEIFHASIKISCI